MALNNAPELKYLIEKLISENVSTNKKSLAALAKLTKKTENVIKFCRNGGLELLIGFIQRTNPKLTDMALSVLANCSLENECRQKIRQLNGIAPLVLLLKNVRVTSIQNRATRALANLGEDSLNAKEIEKLDGIDEIVKLLNETTDKDCQQSLLRALRILCNTGIRKQIILNYDGMKTITSLLSSDRPALLTCCIRTLCELSKDCSKELAQQIQEYEGIKTIVKLCGSDRPVIQHAAVLSLANLTPHSHVRVCIGLEGGVQALCQQAKCIEPSYLRLKAVEGLCFCCREAVNRIKVRESGALELLLKLFCSHEHRHLHRKLVLAFTCFYYDEPSLEILLNGGIVQGLVTHLKTVISNVSTTDDDEDDFSDHISFTSDFSSPSVSPRTASNSFAADVKELAANSESTEFFLEKVETFASEINCKESQVNRKTTNFKRKPKSRVLFPDESDGLAGMSSKTLIAGAEGHSLPAEELQNESNTDNSASQRVCPISSTPDKSVKVAAFIEPLLISPPAIENQTKLNLKSPSVLFNDTQVSHSTVSSNHFNLTSPLISKSDSFFSTSPATVKRYPGHNAIVMLSRFSQMTDPSSFLISKSCMTVLLDYLYFVPHPSPKCFRLLNRLTVNPLCFKSLVVNRMANTVYQQLICGYKCITHCSCNAAESSDTQSHKDETKSELVLSCCQTRKGCCCQKIPPASQSSCFRNGNQLLENLRTQAKTPYGKGVLRNLLQRGNSDDRIGCVLTLPHVCSSKTLCRELLGEQGGLKMLIDHLCTDPSDEILPAVVECFAVLASTWNVATGDSISGTQEESLAGEDVEDGAEVFEQACNKKRLRLSKETKRKASEEFGPTLDLTSREPDECKYLATHCQKFDLMIQLDDGKLVPCHRSVLIKESQVFTAMLSANYIEATKSLLHIPDVKYEVFAGALHLLYGCSDCVSNNLSFESSLHLEINDESRVIKNQICSKSPCLNSQHTSAETGLPPSIPVSLHHKFDFWIDLLAMTDRFIFDRVKAFAEEQLMLIVEKSTVVSACIHAKFHHSNSVVWFCLRYLLTKVSTPCCRYRLFKELLNSKEKEAIMEELYNLLLLGLN